MNSISVDLNKDKGSLKYYKKFRNELEHGFLAINDLSHEQIMTINVYYIIQFLLYLHIILYIMKATKPFLLPKMRKILEELGANIKLARLRRKFSAEQVAERANITRVTLLSIEKGSPGVAMGNYMQVLFALGLEKDLLRIASDDELGRKLVDANLLVKERAPKKSQDKLK